MEAYLVHMISFRNLNTPGYNVVTSGGGNCQPWHLDVLEKWIAEQRERLSDVGDLV